MSNYINFLNHTTTKPPFYHRRYDHDLPEEQGNQLVEWQDQAKRIALVALPFLSLYRPAGSVISLSMGASRIFSHGYAVYSAGDREDWVQFASQIGQTLFAVCSVTATFFSFTLGLLITTGVDIILSVIQICQHLYKEQYLMAGEEVLQTLGSTFYLAIMLTGSLEVILVSTLLQAAISFYQAGRELAGEGRYLEVIAKTSMGIIRLYQTLNYIPLIQRRNQLLEIQKYLQLSERAQRAKEVRHLLDSPLTNLEEQIDKRRVGLSNAENQEYDMGSHFHGLGKGLVKGANLAFRTRVIDGQTVTEIDFKVNHVFRTKIQGLIEELKGMNLSDMQDVLSLAGSQVKDVKIEKGTFPVGSRLIGSSYKILLQGLGTIQIGGSTDYPNLYDRVIVQMDKSKTVYDFHEMMSFMELDQALQVSTRDDMNRLKIGSLFHQFCPRQATPFEHTEAFFSLPIGQLKEEMFKKAPEFREVFDTYFEKMRKREILPGRIVYGMPGLPEEAYALGARAMTAGITGAYSGSALYDRVASILKMGMLSSQLRDTSSMNVQGLSKSADYWTGSEDRVFTQMLTDNNCRQKMPLSNLDYYSRVQMLISLDALEMGTYQYPLDFFGIRKIDVPWRSPYLDRPNLREFIQHQQASSFVYGGHEVMFKERIAPSFFTGLIVPDMGVREELLSHLRMRAIVQLDSSGAETILNVPINRFIRVGTKVTEELIR